MAEIIRFDPHKTSSPNGRHFVYIEASNKLKSNLPRGHNRLCPSAYAIYCKSIRPNSAFGMKGYVEGNIQIAYAYAMMEIVDNLILDAEEIEILETFRINICCNNNILPCYIRFFIPSWIEQNGKRKSGIIANNWAKWKRLHLLCKFGDITFSFPDSLEEQREMKKLKEVARNWMRGVDLVSTDSCEGLFQPVETPFLMNSAN